ncbi:MAG: helix-turn-helix domain-containing protein [Sphingobacteriaceae bacterium]|nr:helix-turn-helix domain-containing protein [Sphingobacteriaceae bacterium]
MANEVLEKPHTLQGIDATLVIIGGKWKIQILWSLRSKAKRFSEIKEEVHGITQKMLTQQLKEFVKDGIISRKSYPEIPPRVEYKLTDYGKTLVPVLDTLNKWGDLHLGKSKPSSTQQTKEAVKTQQLGLF